MFSIPTLIARWLERRRVAAELTGLNDRILNDIGLSRDEIEEFSRRAAELAHPVQDAEGVRPVAQARSLAA